MSCKINLIVAIPPGVAVRKSEIELAHMIYAVGRGFRLYRHAYAASVTGGYMVLDINRYIGGGPARSFVGEVISECQARKYRGIVIESGAENVSPGQLVLSRLIAKAAADNGIRIFVPQPLSEVGDNVVVRVSSALSGGTLSRHLEEAVARYGQARIALEVERVCMDFTLPSSGGVGRVIGEIYRKNLQSRHNATAFFSGALASNYFLYTQKGKTHIVLFDNAASIRYKLSVAARHGISDAFLFYPQVSGILPEISWEADRLHGT